MELPYTRLLQRDEDGDIMAIIPELDGCRAHGANEIEALENLREAQRDWLDLALDNPKLVVPPPADAI